MRIGLSYTGTEWKHENYVRWLQGGEGFFLKRGRKRLLPVTKAM